MGFFFHKIPLGVIPLLGTIYNERNDQGKTNHQLLDELIANIRAAYEPLGPN